MAADPDNAGRGQRERFAHGCSGNPAGMKLGTRHRTARLVKAKIEVFSAECPERMACRNRDQQQAP